MDLGSQVFDWIVISGTSGWSSRAVNGHGKENWCQYVRSRRLDDERRIHCALNNRLWSRYWAMGWLLPVWASCDWALVGGFPDVYSSSNKEERTGLLLVHAWELLWLCLSGNYFDSQSSLIGETRGDSEAQLRTASVQSIGVWKFGEAIWKQRIEGHNQFPGRDPLLEGRRKSTNRKFEVRVQFVNPFFIATAFQFSLLCFELFPKTKPPNIDPIELLTPRSSPLPLHPNLLIPRPTGDGTLNSRRSSIIGTPSNGHPFL